MLKSLFGLALAAAIATQSGDQWPELPSTGFISGRAATVEDVAAGNAVFSMQGTGRGALSIEIPQYAYWTAEDGDRLPMIVVQAEVGPNGEEIVGLRGMDGSEVVATRAEIALLGRDRPR